MMRILGLIPARGGSKGIARKNIKLLQGKELVRYSIESALACPSIERVVVSTEDQEIADISRRAGAEVPFQRPADLASDQAPTIDTVVHALRFFADQGVHFDALCLLQPTVPFRDAVDLEKAIRKFMEQKADSLISVREVPHHFNPHWVFEVDSDSGYLKTAKGGALSITRRQDLPPAFYRDGSVYLTRSEVVLQKHSLYGEKIIHHQMVASPPINIDGPADWLAAEQYALENQKQQDG